MADSKSSGDRFEASAVCQKIVGLFGQQALTAFAAQVLDIYEAQFAISDNDEDEEDFECD
ncbi:hypothetical protein R9X47_03720 [Wukongibacter baidiensis]|uniref:hypothetical protein n=1 Tax=Wukongibacter baidiensis TaxID=1723361 RepID=UPI003D7FE751